MRLTFTFFLVGSLHFTEVRIYLAIKFSAEVFFWHIEEKAPFAQ